MEVRYYVDENGKSPFEEWLRNLKDKQAKSRIFKEITKLELGLLGDPKSLGKGLYEKKLKYSTAYRIYYGYHDFSMIILLTGSGKNDQKKTIEKARSYLENYKKQRKSMLGGHYHEKSK